MDYCVGPIRDEYGVYCRWGIDQNETPDCVACHAAAEQAAEDGSDYLRELMAERLMEMEDSVG